MNGVTGRMGTNQHLIRSIVAIREQGGVALGAGTRIMPDPILVGRNADKLEALARVPRRAALDHRPRRRAGRPRTTASTSTPRRRACAPRLVRQAIAAGKHVYCEKPTAPSARRGAGAVPARRSGGRQARRRAGQALAARAAEAQAADRLRLLRAHPVGARRVRLLGLRGRLAAGATALLELPQGGRRRHHRRHALPLALRDRQPLRPGEGGVAASAPRTFRSAWTKPARPTPAPPTTLPTRPSSSPDATVDRRQFNCSWCTRVRRDDLLTLQVDGTQGSAVAGLADCWIQPRRRRPKPVWNPDIPQPIDFFDDWQKMPDNRSLRQRLQGRSGSCSSATWSPTSRSAGTCSKAPRACNWPNWACRAGRERRWVDVPELGG